MISTSLPIEGSARVIVVGDVQSLTRGRAVEFRHRGLTLVERPAIAAALVEVGRDPDVLLLVPTALSDMAAVDFVKVVRTLSQVPVIVGVGESGEPQVVSELFDQGATTAVTLPATPSRLADAVRACSSPPHPTAMDDLRLELGAIVLDPVGFRATWHGIDLPLTPHSFAVLARLMTAFPQAITPSDLDVDWDVDDAVISDRLRGAMHRLRFAFLRARPDLPSPIVTVHSVGYRLAPGPGPATLRVDPSPAPTGAASRPRGR